MDPTDSIPAADLAGHTDRPSQPGRSIPTDKASRRLHARGVASHLSVPSDLDGTQPVTEAEIRLILAVLGDEIAQILDLTSCQCPASVIISDG